MNTLYFLMAEYETANVELEKVCVKYFGLEYNTALRRAPTQQLPVPVYKTGTQKSPWLVNIKDLADHIDTRRQQAKKDHKAMNHEG